MSYFGWIVTSSAQTCRASSSLPRWPRAAASKNPTMEKVFDYTNDPLVTNGTYASAEELCNKHFVK